MNKRSLAGKKRMPRNCASSESRHSPFRKRRTPSDVLLAALVHRIKPPVRVDAFSGIHAIVKTHFFRKKRDLLQAVFTLLADDVLVDGGEYFSQGPNWCRAREAYDRLPPRQQAVIMWLAEQITKSWHSEES